MWVEPGNAWVKEMRWQHLNKKFQFLAGLSHTSYERTRENTLEYTSGHQFKPELTFNYAPDNTQFLLRTIGILKKILCVTLLLIE